MSSEIFVTLTCIDPIYGFISQTVRVSYRMVLLIILPKIVQTSITTAHEKAWKNRYLRDWGFIHKGLKRVRKNAWQKLFQFIRQLIKPLNKIQGASSVDSIFERNGWFKSAKMKPAEVIATDIESKIVLCRFKFSIYAFRHETSPNWAQSKNNLLKSYLGILFINLGRKTNRPPHKVSPMPVNTPTIPTIAIALDRLCIGISPLKLI